MMYIDNLEIKDETSLAMTMLWGQRRIFFFLLKKMTFVENEQNAIDLK